MFEVGKDILKSGCFQSNENSAEHKRLHFVYWIFIVVFIVFCVRTLFLGFQGLDRNKNISYNKGWVIDRADIVDRNGDILAKNVLIGNIKVYPQRISAKDKDSAAQLIHQISPSDYSLAD